MSTASPDTRIKHGIEFFHVEGRGEDSQCARCGSSTYFVSCGQCGGEGETEDEDWQFEGEFYTCDICEGEGGWLRCISSAEWCEAHPMPGRESQPVMGIKKGEVLD
jgi:hypothetical protein